MVSLHPRGLIGRIYVGDHWILLHTKYISCGPHTNERYKIYQTGFLFYCLDHATGVGLWYTGGAQGVKKKFEHGLLAYQIDRDDEQNRMQVKFSPYGHTGDLGVRSKGQISLNFSYKVNFKDFYTKLCVCSHK